MSSAPAAFWVDRDYDRENASDGLSRYGAYLRDASFEPWTDHDQAVEWAVFAWRRATGPVMSPGYVRYHPRVVADIAGAHHRAGGPPPREHRPLHRLVVIGPRLKA